jgi:monoamine oxidase
LSAATARVSASPVPDPDLLSLAAEVGVEIVPGPKRGPRLAGVAYANGQRTVTPVGQEPPSAPSKLSADEQKLGYEGREQKSTRLVVETRRRFWRERGEDGNAETDLAVGWVRDETDGQPGQGGVLGSYLAGPEARPWSRLGDDDLARRLIKRWDDDPFARGAYAWFKPGQHAAFGPALARPEGRVHFAGCHTSYRPGFMHGALASARRVVEEIEAAERATPGP